jgi:BlaI family penicillinase repressor
MKEIPQISEAELEVMKILWKCGEATSSQIIEELIKGTEWKPKTIQTLITRLVAKEAVKSEKINGKTFMYYPKVSEDAYKKHVNESFLKKIYNGSINLMLSSFIKDNKLSKKDIEDLKKLLDDEVK